MFHLHAARRSFALTVLALLATISITAFTAIQLPTVRAQAKQVSDTSDLPLPPWWSGAACDTKNYQTATKGATDRADHAHPDGIPAQPLDASAASPMGASYRGVVACGPRPDWDTGAPKPKYEPEVSIGGFGEFEWECTELVFRYMYLAYDHQSAYSAFGGNVVWNYTHVAHLSRLMTYNNDTPGIAPQPGDVISFGDPEKTNRNNPGHVAIVIPSDTKHAYATDADGGTGFITILQQNAQDPITTVPVSMWKVADLYGMHAADWLHDPQSPTPVPSPLRFTRTPTIQNISATSATVSWATSIPADSSVTYSTRPQSCVPSCGHTVSNAHYTPTHAVTLTGLSPATTYYFTVSSTEGQQHITAAPGSFTTVAACPASARTSGSGNALADMLGVACATPTPLPVPTPTTPPTQQGDADSVNGPTTENATGNSGAIIGIPVTFQNTGGTTWSASSGYQLVCTGNCSGMDPATLPNLNGQGTILPGHPCPFILDFHLPTITGTQVITSHVQMAHGGKPFGVQVTINITVHG